MRCTSPITAWESPSGGSPILSPWSGVELGREFLIGCGKCLGCQLDRSSSWATRAVHESRYFDALSFLTLSWADAHMPANPEDARHELRKFVMRVRKMFGPGLRFFGCMELGERFSRPHAHFCVYGEAFTEDAEPVAKSKTGNVLWRSPVLERLWTGGFSWVGEFSAESAAYVARYCVKKADQPSSVSLAHPVTGEVVDWPTVYRPFYPLRPALGVRFVDEFPQDCWSGLRARGGARIRTPRAYSKRLERLDPARYDERKSETIAAVTAARDLHEESPARLAVKAEVMRARLRFVSERS